jgi:hypothetical protein
MRRTLLPLFFLVSSLIPHPSSFAQRLPTFEDFRSADRERRQTGQRQTVESLRLMQIDSNKVARLAAQNPHNPEILLGAAELGGDWSAALTGGGTGRVVTLRFACASAVKHDYETALRWFRFCETNDTGNVVPWLGELWVLRQQDKLPESFRAPDGAKDYRDYAVPAARARVHVLETIGYSPYAARRIGLMQNTFVESMAQDLSRDPNVQKLAGPFLLNAARAMQRRPTFLLTELVGESLERAVLAAKPEANEGEFDKRFAEIDARRKELRQLVATTEKRTADFATESEMVQYFDDVLALGEEIAMKRLQLSIRGAPSVQSP